VRLGERLAAVGADCVELLRGADALPGGER
jgi:hypothetical protein